MFNISRLESIEDPELYNRITTYIYTSDNTSKQTGVNRFRVIDGELLNFLHTDVEHEIHDIAVASGQTSYELYLFLRKNKLTFNLSISDKFNKYYITGRNIVRIYDIKGKFVCGYMFGILADNNYYVNRLFFLTKALGALLSVGKSVAGKRKQISAYTRQINDLITRGIISDIEYDIFSTRILDRFTFVRCMNILNLDYFSDNKLSAAVMNIVQSLKENGILQIGRTVNTVNNVSFYRRVNGKLIHLSDRNDGTEIKGIIDRFNEGQCVDVIAANRMAS